MRQVITEKKSVSKDVTVYRKSIVPEIRKKLYESN